MAEDGPKQVRQSAVLQSAPYVFALVGEPLICTDEAGLIVLFNLAAEETFGYSSGEVLGQPVEVLLPQRYRSDHRTQVSSFATGEGPARRIMGHSRQVCGLRKNGEEFPAEAIVSREVVEGKIYLTVALRDVTERRRLERERELVSNELAHRVKNVLAVVDALVALTARDAENVDGFARLLRERLGALARTQDVVRENDGRNAGLEELLCKELSQFRSKGRENLKIEGPTVELKASSALILSLAFHELATNAAKYGALRTRAGEIRVGWRICDEEAEKSLEITWRELGGPRVQPPARTGFGTKLITKSVARGLRASVDLEYPPDGLICRMQIPLTAL
ncbi:HWE histidine kinase domain-containing protein [Aurantiacibacter hainanensis]|uniref:HWE histidine kinase domain-containing protein n=1 Tax=Aurantiacibacter hainanensis TaxID=3076114 RepID=UPI0030C6E985